MNEDTWFSGCIWGCASLPFAIVIMVVQSLFQNSKRGPYSALRSNQRRLGAERKDETLEVFKESFAADDVPEIAIRAVYQVLSVSAFGQPLPPHRDDSLIHVYGWGSMMDPDMVLKAIAGKCWITLGGLNDAGDTPRTVQGLGFLASRAIEQQNRQAAAGSLLRAADPILDESSLLRPATGFEPDHDQHL